MRSGGVPGVPAWCEWRCARGGSRTRMSGTSFQTSLETVRKWHILAERRRRHYVELYRSERWRRFFTEEAFLLHMRDVIQNAETWANILERMTESREATRAA